MKYGATLLESLNPEWRFFYIEYGQLKTFLKDRLKINGNGQFTESDETEFVNMLENELDKVYSFQKLKSGEIQRHVKYCEHSIEEIGKASNEVGADPAEVSMRYLNVENEINGIIVEVNELAKFQRLNFAGFIKIVKKHDKHTGIPLKTMFSLRLSKKPFYKENFDPLLLKLSRLCEIVRNGGKTATSSSGKSASAAAAGAGQSFVRQTTKYWVHPDNVMELKLFVLKHLPVLVYKAQAPKTFGPKTDADADSDESVDPAITSIYFDNDDLQLYLGRLEKSEGAEAVRLRWYGNARNEEIFVERKTHREDWTGEKSVKERFMIKEKHVNDYLNGKYNMSKYAAKLRETGAKGEDQINSMEQLSNEIQHTIIEKKLHPLVRTFYNRMAFQLPGDARVRISLDTELTMVREDNYDGVERSGSNWRRTDINTDYPFTHLADSDVCRFPYAILEVKLQTHVGTEPPQWVEELINSHLVEAVPKFSKFIHGVSTLLESRAPLFPFWLPQMDKDIRKPRTSELGISRASGRASVYSGSGDASPTHSRPHSGLLLDPHTARPTMTTSSTAVSSGDLGSGEASGAEYADEEEGIETGTARDENSPLLGHRASALKRIRRTESGLQRLSRFFHLRGDDQLQPIASPAPGGQSVSPAAQQPAAPAPVPAGGIPQTGPGGKRIAIPVRVEPKVYFANERTFLSWLNFAVMLGSLALGLLNFGDSVGRISGVLFTAISMCVMVYALLLFQWRAERIRRREAGPYDDRVGPTILVVILAVGVIANVYLKLTREL